LRGTIIKRGATYSIVLDLGRGPDGKRIRKWHSGYRTKRDAERARVELLARLDQGGYVEPSRLTVAAFLRDHWLPGLAGQVTPPGPITRWMLLWSSTCNAQEGLVDRTLESRCACA
jgi:hypothetical protein